MASAVRFFQLVCFLCCLLFEDVLGFCQPLTYGPQNASLLSESFKSNYSRGDLALYKCNSQSGGHGYVAIYCETGDVWSEANRKCGDAAPFGGGTIAGCSLLGFTMVVMVTFLLASTAHKNATVHAEYASSEDSTEPVVEKRKHAGSRSSNGDVTLSVSESANC